MSSGGRDSGNLGPGNLVSGDPGWVDELARDDSIQRVLHAFAHPVRRYLLSIIGPDDVNAGDLAGSAAAVFGISSARGSQHLQVLADAGLVDIIPVGTWRFYRRNSSGIVGLRDWLGEFAQ